MDTASDIRNEYCQLGTLALRGMSKKLFDSIEVSARSWSIPGVMVYGDGGMVKFYFDRNEVSWLEAVYFGKDGEPIRAMPCAPELAGNILANLSLPEIVDYIDRFNAGKDPALTDYVEEVIC